MTVIEAEPFIKWAGGKRQLLEQLLRRVPEEFAVYHEPFSGGLALFFKLRSLGRIKEAHLSDTNAELINLYQQVRDNVDSVITWLKEVLYVNEENFFYDVRAANPEEMEPSERAARFIYLNRTCFNGLYRVNKKGKFNVPFGKYKNPTICNEPKLRAGSAALQGVHLHLEDFRETGQRIGKGDFVYFDPPFYPVSETANFVSFTEDDFNEDDHYNLRDMALALGQIGAHVLVSNSDTPFVIRAYHGNKFTVDRVGARRNINSEGTRRGGHSELLIQPR